jgi:tRNA (guanine-N7-)-methyltransferase
LNSRRPANGTTPDHERSTGSDQAHPHIRSFTLRRGRATRAQQQALDQLLPTFGVAYTTTPIDLPGIFNRDAATILEIGCGMGETTVSIAEARPDINFIGVEVFSAGVGALLKGIRERGLSNVRIVHHDAVEVVRDMVAPSSLAGIHIFFPDPWPKKRHHKRRLVQPAFVSALADRLKPHGYLHFATDWEHYAQQALQVFDAEPTLLNLHMGYAPAPKNPLCARPVTKFHARGDLLGHRTYDLVFARRP